MGVVCVSMNETTSELLADANETVREQLTLAWREHTERVRNVLEAQWPERMERVLEETVAALAARIDDEYEDALGARVEQANRAGETARRELIQRLNQITRRLRNFEDQRQWSNTWWTPPEVSAGVPRCSWFAIANCIWKPRATSTTRTWPTKCRSIPPRPSRQP